MLKSCEFIRVEKAAFYVNEQSSHKIINYFKNSRVLLDLKKSLNQKVKVSSKSRVVFQIDVFKLRENLEKWDNSSFSLSNFLENLLIYILFLIKENDFQKIESEANLLFSTIKTQDTKIIEKLLDEIPLKTQNNFLLKLNRVLDTIFVKLNKENESLKNGIKIFKNQFLNSQNLFQVFLNLKNSYNSTPRSLNSHYLILLNPNKMKTLQSKILSQNPSLVLDSELANTETTYKNNAHFLAYLKTKENDSNFQKHLKYLKILNNSNIYKRFSLFPNYSINKIDPISLQTLRQQILQKYDLKMDSQISPIKFWGLTNNHPDSTFLLFIDMCSLLTNPNDSEICESNAS